MQVGKWQKNFHLANFWKQDYYFLAYNLPMNKWDMH